MNLQLAMWGMFWGGISALSLPLGAVIGLWSKPKRKVVSGLMAFGGGALLFALTIELFGHALHHASNEAGQVTEVGLLLTTMLGALLGGLLFELLNYLLSKKGGHVRKRALVKKKIANSKRKRAGKLLKVLLKNRVLQSLEDDQFIRLTEYVTPRIFYNDDILFQENEDAAVVYFITKGKINVEHHDDRETHKVATLSAGDILGEIALVSNSKRTASARAVCDVEVLELNKEHFESFLNVSIHFKTAIMELAVNRTKELAEKNMLDAELASKTEAQHMAHLASIAIGASEKEVTDEARKHTTESNSAMAIWLGIALDGIPESLVIGMLVVTAAATGSTMSLAFVIGVFLANLPEAMSSAVTMQAGGMKFRKIVLMWMSLCILTGLGAFIGAAFFPAHPEGSLQYVIFGLEGLAAGAMLTMIAETMLPEAFEQGGGTIAGLSTLIGFLAALSVKLIQ